MNSRQDEDDRVQRLLSLLDPAKEPESSNHVDDDTLVLLTGGMANSEELAALRLDLVVCLPCRRMVGQILMPRRTEPARSPTGGYLGMAPPCTGNPGLRRGGLPSAGRDGRDLVLESRRGCAKTGAPTRPRQRAALGGVVPAATWAGNAAAPEASSRNSPQSHSSIDSPQAGIAVVLMVANGRWETLLRGEGP